jgi:uncharacterized protein DUF1833
MRTLSSSFRDELQGPLSAEVVLLLVTLTHETMPTPIRFCSDTVDYVYQGDTYVGASFYIAPISDNEGPQKTRAVIQNVDRRIGEAILALAPPAIQMEVQVFAGSSGWDSSIPRQPVGTPSPEYIAQELFLRNIQCDPIQISADVTGPDHSTEPWPSIRATPDLLPAIFR